MARTNGPLLSLSARGTIADAITYRRHPHATVTTRKPATPASWSAAQTDHRATVAALALAWRSASTEDHASWDALAIPRRTTRWAEYSRENLARLRNGLEPTTAWPPSTTPPIDMQLRFVFWTWSDALQTWSPDSAVPDPEQYYEIDPNNPAIFDGQKEEHVYWDKRRGTGTPYRTFFWDEVESEWVPSNPHATYPDWPNRTGTYDTERITYPQHLDE